MVYGMDLHSSLKLRVRDRFRDGEIQLAKYR